MYYVYVIYIYGYIYYAAVTKTRFSCFLLPDSPKAEFSGSHSAVVVPCSEPLYCGRLSEGGLLM